MVGRSAPAGTRVRTAATSPVMAGTWAPMAGISPVAGLAMPSTIMGPMPGIAPLGGPPLPWERCTVPETTTLELS